MSISPIIEPPTGSTKLPRYPGKGTPTYNWQPRNEQLPRVLGQTHRPYAPRGRLLI